MLCKPFTCLEGPGALCKLCSDQSKRTGQNQCSLCNPGYFLAGDLTCKPYTCETGAADACFPAHNDGHVSRDAGSRAKLSQMILFQVGVT